MNTNTASTAPWFTLDMIIFVIANILLLRLPEVRGVFGQLTFLNLLILGLASYRLANIVSNETITKPLRAPFVDEKEQMGKIIEQPKPRGFLGAMGRLIYCPSCTGVWIAGVLAYGYVFLPVPTSIIALIFALSAIERIVAYTLGRIKVK